MADHESTMKWKVDIGDLTKAMQEAKRSINQANAEFKTATAGMDKWSKSTDGLEAKIAQLNKTLPYQKDILADLEKQYELTAANMGENSKEAVDLKIKIENQRATIVKTETSINKYNDQLNQMQKEQAESETASGKLNKTIEEQQEQVNSLKKEYADAVLQYGKNSDEAKALAKQIEDLSEELVDNKKRLKDADRAADEFDKTIEETADDADDLTGGFTVMKGALADLVAQGISMAIDGLKNLASAAYDAWTAFDDGADAIIVATGATGDAAEELLDVYDKVSSNVLEDFETIGTAIGEVNTRFGLTGDALQDVSERFLKFAKLNGVDVKTSIDSVQSAMEAFGLESKDTADVLDVLNKAGQDTGESVDKLAQDVVTNSAALQEMGFNLSDSVMFLANLSKNGVDTSSTLAGLKKALQNAAKEGKPMSEALDDIEKSINGAKSETEAINLAVDLFGAKAGSSIAKAVRSGRLSFDKFGTTLDEFRGNIETTYDSIMDVPDDIGLAIQNLRKTAAKAVDSFFQNHGAKITKYVNDFTNKTMPKIEKAVGDVFEFINEHGDDVVSVLKAIATAFITYKAVGTITSVVGAFKTLFEAVKGGTSIMTAFNTAMGLNPYALVAAGIAGLTLLIADYAQKQKDAIKEQYSLNEAQQEAVDKASALADSYAALDKARDEQVNAINNEFGYLSQLKDEYNGLIDENGEVKKGYEDRANFILTRLAEAMGIEVSQIQELIDQNGKLGDSIDEVMRKQQAQAILAANEQIYTDAIANRADALNTLTDAQKTLDEAEQTYMDTSAEAQKVWDNYYELMSRAPEEAAKYLSANDSIITANSVAQASYDKAKQGVEDAENAWIGFNSTIQNYEGLSAAIISGDADKINEAMANMTYNFITAETGNRESLERQVENYEINLKNLEDAIERGTPNVTQDMVDQARSMVDAANAELDKLPPEASATATEAGTLFGTSLGAQKGFALSNAQSLVNNAEIGITPAIDKLKKTGDKSGKQFGDAVGSKTNKSNAKTSGEELADEAVKGSESENGEEGGANKSGSNFGEGFFNGIGSWLTSVWERGKALAKKALAGLKEGQEEGSPSKLTRKSGEFFGEGFELGISSMIDPVRSAASDMAKEAVDALSQNMNEQMLSIGEDGAHSLIEGMNGVLPDMSASINGLKASVAASSASMNGVDVGTFESGGGDKVQNVTFNQTINSPKALSRLELYRETNSLLFSAKVRMSNV